MPLQIKGTAAYIAKCIRKVQSQSYASLDPDVNATKEFNSIVNGAFDGKVITDKRNSWFKRDGGPSRVLVSWPGSFYRRADILKDPRWEDFIFERRRGAEANRHEYFGNGYTERERVRDEVDLTSYLKVVKEEDLYTLHEI